MRTIPRYRHHPAAAQIVHITDALGRAFSTVSVVSRWVCYAAMLTCHRRSVCRTSLSLATAPSRPSPCPRAEVCTCPSLRSATSAAASVRPSPHKLGTRLAPLRSPCLHSVHHPHPPCAHAHPHMYVRPSQGAGFARLAPEKHTLHARPQREQNSPGMLDDCACPTCLVWPSTCQEAIECCSGPSLSGRPGSRRRVRPLRRGRSHCARACARAVTLPPDVLTRRALVHGADPKSGR